MIKKIAVFVLFLICMQLNAQENKNKWMINGAVNYFQNNTDIYYLPDLKLKQSNTFVGVHLGYFITNNFALGILNEGSASVHEVITSDTSASVTSQYSTSYSPGIFAKYNRQIQSSRFGFFLQLDSKYSWEKNRFKTITGNSDFTRTSASTGIVISLTPGIIYFINKKISIETSFGNLGVSSLDGYDSNAIVKRKAINVNLKTNFSLATMNFGFTYYFGCKKKESDMSKDKD